MSGPGGTGHQRRVLPEPRYGEFPEQLLKCFLQFRNPGKVLIWVWGLEFYDEGFLGFQALGTRGCTHGLLGYFKGLLGDYVGSYKGYGRAILGNAFRGVRP